MDFKKINPFCKNKRLPLKETAYFRCFYHYIFFLYFVILCNNFIKF